MNSLPRKIVVCLFIIMFGINLGSAPAGEVDQCVSQSCFFCTGKPMAHNEHTPIDDSAGHECYPSSADSPCNLKKESEQHALVFIVSSIRVDRPKSNGFTLFSLGEPSLLQFIRGNSTIGHSWITPDPIPIYLQNLSLLC
jgi:hypothetical protein